MTDATPARHSRKGLIVPFAVVLVALAAWTGWWFWLTDQVETRLTAQVEVLRQDGWTITHAPVRTTGWPFRTRVSMPQADILAPSGHGVAAPELVAEASSWSFDAVDKASLKFAAKVKAQAEEQDRMRDEAARQAGFAHAHDLSDQLRDHHGPAAQDAPEGRPLLRRTANQARRLSGHEKGRPTGALDSQALRGLRVR